MSETSTALAVLTRNNFLAIADDSEMRRALEANMLEGDTFSEGSLIRVKTPSAGALKWTINGISGPEEVTEIEGAMVFQCKRGVLWRSLDPTPGSKPVLSTSDLKLARMVCDKRDVPKDMLAQIENCVVKLAEKEGESDIYDWAALPYTQYGSGRNGQGKFAKEQRVLFVLRKTDAWPLMINVQPGSLRAITNFIMQLPVPFWRAVIGLSLKTSKSGAGIDYSEIVPRLKGILSEEDGQLLYSRYTAGLKASYEAGKLHVDEE